MNKFSPYRIATDGKLFRLELGYFSTDPKISPTWTPASEEMTHLAQAQIALDHANNPPVWRPVSTA